MPYHPTSSDARRIVLELSRIIKASDAMDRAQTKSVRNMTSQQVRAAVYLVDHQDASVKDLARHLGISQPRASRLAEELVQGGHAIRNTHSDDRRKVKLRITPVTWRLAQQAQVDRTEALLKALAEAAPDHVDLVVWYLSRISESFEAAARRRRA